MTGKTNKNPQLNVFRIPLVNEINTKYELVELAQRINRNYFEGVEGDMINTIMADVAFNMMELLRKIRIAIYLVLDLLNGSWSVKYATVQNY